MSVKTLRQVLIEIAESNRDNPVAQIIAYNFSHLDFSKKDTFFESLLQHYTVADGNTNFDFEKLKEAENRISATALPTNKDYRIKNFKIAAVRGIPGKDENGIPFGMDFDQDHEDTKSAIILANNGTGKSSIFSAFEMIFTNEISEKKLRYKDHLSLNKTDYDEYLECIFSKYKPSCEINTPSGKFSFFNQPLTQSQIRSINPSNYFISDYKIYENGQRNYVSEPNNSNSFHTLIAESLGLKDFLEFLDLAKQTASFNRRKETTAYNQVRTRLDKTRNQQDAETKTLESLKNSLKEILDSKPSVNADPIENRRTQLSNLLNQELGFNSDLNRLNTLIQDFTKLYREIQGIDLDQNEIQTKDFLETGLKLLDQNHNCPFCGTSTLSKEQIKDKVSSKINTLKQSLVLVDNLRYHYAVLAEYFPDIANQLQHSFSIIEMDRVALIGFPEFSSIAHRAEELSIQSSSILHDEDFFDFLSQLDTSHRSPSFKEINRFSKSLIQNSSTINNILAIAQSLIEYEKKRNESIQTYLAQLPQPSEPLTPIQRKAQLESEIARLEASIAALTKNIEIQNIELARARSANDALEMIKKNLPLYVPLFESVANQLISESFEIIKHSVEPILASYVNESGLKFEINKTTIHLSTDDDSLQSEIFVAYLTDKDGKKISPDHYFNTFRYKLFCLMVSISMALATRKKLGINFPLIIDDIFYSSDFTSKITFSQFLQNVIKLFHEQTPDMPLQLILFTHDDLIFRSSVDGINYFVSPKKRSPLEPEKPLSSNFFIGRMFKPEDKDAFPSTDSEGNKYWNLLYTIPIKVEQN